MLSYSWLLPLKEKTIPFIQIGEDLQYKNSVPSKTENLLTEQKERWGIFLFEFGNRRNLWKRVLQEVFFIF